MTRRRMVDEVDEDGAKSFRLNILGSVVPLAMFRYLSPVLVSDKTRRTIHVARESHCKE